MNEGRTIKKVFNAQPHSTRSKVRPNLRWIDGLEKELLVLRTKDRKTLEEEGWTRKGFLRRPRPILGCVATEEERK
ncbi:hypothetical protein TNCV_3610071 [Trichonephila clavipes]|nr:hypothetical protein TNCV_3610071 [Trichonephila clavipes]